MTDSQAIIRKYVSTYLSWLKAQTPQTIEKQWQDTHPREYDEKAEREHIVKLFPTWEADVIDGVNRAQKANHRKEDSVWKAKLLFGTQSQMVRDMLTEIGTISIGGAEKKIVSEDHFRETMRNFQGKSTNAKYLSEICYLSLRCSSGSVEICHISYFQRAAETDEEVYTDEMASELEWEAMHECDCDENAAECPHHAHIDYRVVKPSEMKLDGSYTPHFEPFEHIRNATFLGGSSLQDFIKRLWRKTKIAVIRCLSDEDVKNIEWMLKDH